MKLFIDTNIPMEHKPLQEIDWKDLTGCDAVTLVFPMTVVDELDKLSHDPRKKDRARRLRKEISFFIESGVVKSNVKAERVNKPHLNVVEGYGLDKSSSDHWILATVKKYMEDNPGEDVALLTADNGMKFRAKDCGIKPIMLDEKYSIDVESEEQKEIRKLREENTRLKASMPKLSVEFENGTRVTPFQIEEPDFEEYVKEELRKLRYQYPKESLQINFSSVFGKTYTPTDAMTYNSQLDDYYKAYLKYLRESVNLYMAEQLTLEISLVLNNSGAVVAKDVDVEFFIPSPVDLYLESPQDRIPEPNRPNPPILGLLRAMTWSHDTNTPRHIPKKILPPVPIFTTTKEGTKVEFRIESLKQQKGQVLATLYATFKDLNSVKGFNIDYAIRAENIAGVVKDRLNVQVIPVAKKADGTS